jgi:hypothetical protein
METLLMVMLQVAVEVQEHQDLMDIVLHKIKVVKVVLE